MSKPRTPSQDVLAIAKVSIGKTGRLARAIQKVRKERQITQEELAERLNVSQSSLVRIETGRQVPNLKRLQQIARALDVKSTS